MDYFPTRKIMTYHALILGGGKSPVEPRTPKGNTPFRGQALAARMYQQVRDVDFFERIFVVMNPESSLALQQQDRIVRPTYCKGAWRSAYAAIQEGGPADYFIFAADLPFCDTPVISAFVEKVQTAAADIVFPLIPKELNMQRFPERKRTYQPFAEGEFVAGNIGYISQEGIVRNAAMAQCLANSYHSSFRFVLSLMQQMGILFSLRSNHPKLPVTKLPLYRTLFPLLSIREAEEKCSQILNSTVRIVPFPHPEACYDIDSVVQLHQAEEIAGLEAVMARS